MLKVYLYIGIFIGVCLIGIIEHGIRNHEFNIEPEEVSVLRILVISLALGLIITWPISIFEFAIYMINKGDFENED